MSTTTTLALVIVLTAVNGQPTEQTVATLPESDCLAAMRAIWDVPAETVGYDALGAVPALDAYCTDPRDKGE